MLPDSIPYGHVVRVCDQCHNEFTIAAYTLPFAPCRFCTTTCYNVFRRSLWRKVVKSDGPDGCWLWTGGTGRGGYGKTKRDGKTITTHRLAWEEVSGPIPAGMFVLHTCDVRNCVRNDEVGIYVVDGIALPRLGHLFLGTALNNMRDMGAKGRKAPTSPNFGVNPPRGETHPFAKLSDAQVREIRERFAAGGVTMTRLSAEYGVAISCISEIVNLKSRVAA